MNEADKAAKLGLPVRSKRATAIRELLELRGVAGAWERASTEPMTVNPADMVQLCDFVLEALEPLSQGCPCGVEHSAEDQTVTLKNSAAVTVDGRQGVGAMSICRNCGGLYVIALVEREKAPAPNR